MDFIEILKIIGTIIGVLSSIAGIISFPMVIHQNRKLKKIELERKTKTHQPSLVRLPSLGSAE